MFKANIFGNLLLNLQLGFLCCCPSFAKEEVVDSIVTEGVTAQAICSTTKKQVRFHLSVHNPTKRVWKFKCKILVEKQQALEGSKQEEEIIRGNLYPKSRHGFTLGASNKDKWIKLIEFKVVPMDNSGMPIE